LQFSAVSGECLTLTAKKYFNEYLTPDDHISASSSIAYDLESVDIDGEGRIYQNGTNYQYDYYLKDHLGSTRMVINDQNQITEAIAYQPYGTIVPMEDIATSPQTSTRQQFTGKEFDREGSGVGISGMELYYFGKRYYDPELGVFLTPDPEDQYWSPYTYCGGDPINQIDPDGAFAAGIGLLQFSQTTQQLMSTAALLESGALAIQSVALGQAVSQIFQMAAQHIFGALNAVQQTINKISLIGTIWTIAQIANISNNIQNVISNAAQMSSQGGQQAAQSGQAPTEGNAEGVKETGKSEGIKDAGKT
jgi:RHS repeat-associated protein